MQLVLNFRDIPRIISSYDLNWRRYGMKPTGTVYPFRFNFGEVLFGCILLTNSMGAYQLGGIPLPWLSEMLTIVLALMIVYKSNLYHFPGEKLLIVMIAWLFVVALANQMFLDYSEMMPSQATTSYGAFMALRFLKLVSFLSFLFVTHWFLRKGKIDRLISITLAVGVGVSLFACYVYVAQVLGLPEPSRTRMGTSGEEQSVVFTYAFHRAMGSFQEPSHLAQWLVVPFFLSLAFIKNSKSFLFSILIGFVILLTGSLTGILAVLMGFIVASILLNSFKNLSKFILILLVGLSLFSTIVNNNVGSRASLIPVIVERIRPILFGGGLIASNRGYIYEWLEGTTVPILGYGIGNANIVLSRELSSDLMVSTLNLFLNILFSGGFVSILLLAIFFLTPIYLVFKSKALRKMSSVHYVLAAYVAWIVIYFVHSEEVSLMFAIPYSILVSSRKLLIPEHYLKYNKRRGTPSKAMKLGTQE